MELKNLLDKHNWSDSDLSYEADVIEQEMRQQVSAKIALLFTNYKRSIVLNLLFLLATIVLYVVYPSLDMLVPVGIIGSCFLFLIVTTLYQLWTDNKPDQSQDMKTVLEETLAYDKRMYNMQCRFFSWIFTASALGGMLLGMIVKGWTLQRIVHTTPVVLFIMAFTIGIYALSKSTSFRKFNRRLNPTYHHTKKFIQQQLHTLNDNQTETI